MLKKYSIKKLEDSNRIDSLASFFHNKWKIPLSAYIDSMNSSLKSSTGVPSWYYVTDGDNIIGGLGVIENDFHKRKDLTPNLCAIYVKEDYQNKGIARSILEYVYNDLKKYNIKDVYLITTHTKLYERLGFDYYGDIEEDDGGIVRCYHKKI